MNDDYALCCVCPVLRPKGKPRRPDRGQVCDGCYERLSGDLSAIPEAYALVDSDPVRGTSEIRIREFESRPPLNIGALSLLGPGVDTPLARLDFWAQDWAGMLGQKLPGATVLELCGWLGVRLGWACDNHPAIDEFAQDVREVTGQLRAYGGKQLGERVGKCPRTIHGNPCDTQLYVDPYVHKIECQRCHMTWSQEVGGWVHLRAQQMAAGVEAE
jgi:hypothetical protein